MNSLRAVLFDLDGTLADSAPDIAAALNTSLSLHGLKPLSLDQVKAMVGGGARLLCERALFANGLEAQGSLADALHATFLKTYGARPCVETALYPGAYEALARLSQLGLKLGIATNKPDDLSQAIVDVLGIRRCLGAVIGSTSALALKPAPDMLFRACARLRVAAAEALMVGDSRADIEAARAAGMGCIVFAHGYSSEPVEILGADAVLEAFAELDYALLDRLWRRTRLASGDH